MGTNTVFEGAIRITPKIGPELTEHFGRYFNIRHMSRDLDMLLAAHPGEADRKAHSLLGDGNFGPEGVYYLPDRIKEMSPALNALSAGEDCEGIVEQRGVGTPPAGAPALYCDMILVPSPVADCSYLAWDGTEESDNIADWVEFFAKLLVPLGYHLDGRMLANEEGGMDLYIISVLNEFVRVIPVELPGGTYSQELESALRARDLKISPEPVAPKTVKHGAPTLYVDLDGTLAEWKPAAKPEHLLEEGYFLNLQPNENVVAAIRTLISMRVKVYVLSAFLQDSLYAVGEKHAWVAKYLPELLPANIWLIPCETAKPLAVLSRGESMEQAVLLDDYTKNLDEWAAYGGRGVKLRNGVNGTHGTWKGPAIESNLPPETIVELLKGLLNM